MKTLEISHLLCGLLALGWLSLQAAAQQENVALKKTYLQISKSSKPSSNAANNNTSGVFSTNNCIKTTGDPQQPNAYHWWQVDLGRIYPVRDIIVWAMSKTSKEIYEDNLYPFTITVDDKICVSVIEPPPPSNTRSISVRCPSVMYGQKVRLTLLKTNMALHLCEFQILVPSGVSKCRAGQHGAQCKKTCSDNCGGGRGKNFCDHVTGVCYDGCTGNFAGPTCRACMTGYHGDTCAEQCSSVNSRCTKCTRVGTCRECTGYFMASNCTDCIQGYFKKDDGCQQCSSDCVDSRCDQVTGACNAAGSRIGQSGGGASILLPLSLGILLAYICQF